MTLRSSVLLLSSLASLVLEAAPSSLAAVSPPPEAFHDGDRWVALGDSITHVGAYHHYIELFWLTRYPSQTLGAVNAGIGGDTAEGALARLDWDVLPEKPTVVTIMLGMNDIGRDLYTSDLPTEAVLRERSERIASWDKNLRAIVSRLRGLGVRTVLLTPSCYDQTAMIPAPNHPGANDALGECARRLPEIAADTGSSLVDFYGVMTAFNRDLQAKDPHSTIVGPDRVHPGAAGHLLMARAFLEAQHVPALVSKIVIDARSGQAQGCQNCEVSELVARPESAAFTCEEHALPFPLESKDVPPEERASLIRDLDQEILQVRGLVTGRYELTIDNVPVKLVTAAELAEGINLALEPKTAQFQQAMGVAALLDKKWGAEGKLRGFALCEQLAWQGDPRGVDNTLMVEKLKARIAQLSSSPAHDYFLFEEKNFEQFKSDEPALRHDVAEFASRAHELAQTRPHHFSLRSEGNADALKAP
ncbi:MAG TPA: SGNH/GDSL hydrolase family protein [Opitutaceae bacterium]|jgi:lysophospholipase L1-like esterase|nr:SGNH/GDSL hydrolase family protein [Opitutaceae bacterium]